ncbi:MAG: PHP domain-containing protein [Lachnospiraceae bacterium]|nr:PHP domain-containing protein [Lachnospiraceae bacterium]
MRFDMHCHTKEGSLDGKIPLRDYVLRLKILGYDGMLITDHNSYKAYRQYIRNTEDEAFQNFTILKGVEYDTSDGGHILVIMPSDVNSPLLEMRGMPVSLLIETVHAFHGILGPAHPAGEKYLSILNSKYYHKNPDVLKKFDFIETYNSCITEEANEKAAELAEKYHLPGTGGSDSHKLDCVGLAYTEFDRPIKSESDLIECIKSSPTLESGGSHYPGTSRDHLGIIYDFMLRLYYVYDRVGNRRRYAERVKAFEEMLEKYPNLYHRIRRLTFVENIQQFFYRRDWEKIRSWLDNNLFAGMGDEEPVSDTDPEAEEEKPIDINANAS